MPKDADLWMRSARADFDAASHRSGHISDAPSISQIEDMVQSIALGLKGLTEVIHSLSKRVDRIDAWVQTQQALQEDGSTRQSRAQAAIAH